MTGMLEVKGGTRKRSLKFIREQESEISQNGAVECLRRIHWVNQRCYDRRKATAKKE